MFTGTVSNIEHLEALMHFKRGDQIRVELCTHPKMLCRVGYWMS